MDELCMRVPNVGKEIFNNLNDEDLVKSKGVSRTWSTFMDEEIFFWKRIITKLIGGYNDFKETWRIVTNKVGLSRTMELANAVKFFLSKHPSQQCKDKPCSHHEIPFSPLHIAAEAGQTSLCKFIIDKVEDKNPKILTPWSWGFDPQLEYSDSTPIDLARKNGHDAIVTLIESNIH